MLTQAAVKSLRGELLKSKPAHWVQQMYWSDTQLLGTKTEALKLFRKERERKKDGFTSPPQVLTDARELVWFMTEPE